MHMYSPRTVIFFPSKDSLDDLVSLLNELGMNMEGKRICVAAKAERSRALSMV